MQPVERNRCEGERPTPAFAKQAWSFASSAAVGGAIRRLTSKRRPPVRIFATIFGTTPSWCIAERISPVATAATPSSFAICVAWLCGKVSWVPGRKKSWAKCAPGLPRCERSLIAAWFAWTTSRPPPPPPGPKPPPPAYGWSVTVRSVPMLESGSSAVFRAVEPAGERDHERDSEREPENGQDRPGLPPNQFAAQVAEVEHGPTISRPDKSLVRAS